MACFDFCMLNTALDMESCSSLFATFSSLFSMIFEYKSMIERWFLISCDIILAFVEIYSYFFAISSLCPSSPASACVRDASSTKESAKLINLCTDLFKSSLLLRSGVYSCVYLIKSIFEFSEIILITLFTSLELSR